MTQLEGFPISPQQKHCWQLIQEGVTRNGISILQVKGSDAAAIRHAVESLVMRHEILRTRFVIPPRRKLPIQVVEDSLPAAFKATDHQGQDVTAVCAALLAEARAHVFNLEEGPVVYGHYVDLADCGLLSLCWSSLCGDRHDLATLPRELIAMLDPAAPVGHEEDEDEVVQYTQYSEWLNELAAEDAGGLAYWEQVYQRLASPLASEPARGQMASLCLTDGSTLLAPVQDHPAAFFLTCWHTYLCRAMGAAVGIAVRFDGRTDENLLEARGPFERYLPMSLPYLGERPFADQYAEMLSIWDQNNEFQDFHGLGESDRGETLSHAFSYAVEASSGSHERVDLRPLVQEYRVVPRVLELELIEDADGRVLAYLHYDGAHFDASGIALFGARFLALVRGATAESARMLGSLPVTTEEERHRLLHLFNDTERASVLTQAVPLLFDQVASQNPDRMALACEGECLSFSQLRSQVNRLAHYLRERGVGPDVHVGLCFERNASSIVAMLGVLAAGGGFLPIDATLPPSRMADMLSDAGALLLLSQSDMKHTGLGIETVYLDQLADHLASYPEVRPAIAIEPQHMAYTIYTSGSTGKPKGVVVEHRNLLNYLSGMGEALGLFKLASFASVSTQAADLGYTVIFPPLITGGTLHLIAPDRLVDASRFAAYMTQHQIDCLKITPSHLLTLISESSPDRSLPRRCLVLGGEAAPAGLVERIHRASPNLMIHNHYGPTETTVGVITYHFDPKQPTFFPLGRPIANTRVYLLNEQLEPVPVGALGEMYVAGASVARGYINAESLSAERFPVDPFHGGRMYRTGDLARFDENGTLFFHGRCDHQVKIRGFRVEPGEIECVLMGDERVNQACVVAWEESPLNRHLVAYVVPTSQDATQAGLRKALQEYLAAKLPAYMVPSFFVFLEAFPLNANGKVDRKALPDPREDQAQAYVPPANATERRLVQLWSELLHVDEIGVCTNFFDLGGHSLNGTILMSRVFESFGCDMKLASLFRTPTIRGLADEIHRTRILAQGYTGSEPIGELSSEQLACLAGSSEATGALEAIPILPREHGTVTAPLSLSQERLWFLDQLVGSNNLYNVPYTLRLEGRLDREALEAAFSSLVARHEILRTTFLEVDGVPVQRVGPPFAIKFPFTDLQGQDSATVEATLAQLATEIHALPFDLKNGPLLRFHLVKLGPELHRLFAALHHIVSDGWSISVISREIVAGYHAAKKHEQLALTALPIQFADFAAWQRKRMNKEARQNEVAYWRDKLEGLVDLNLPTDFPRPPVQTYRAGDHSFSLTGKLAEDMALLMRETQITPFTFFMAVNALLYARYSGQRDVVVGTTIANRLRREVEDLVGCFINQLAIRTDLSGNPSFRQLLHRVGDTTLEAYEHQELPFGSLVSDLKWKRDPSRSPIFQVLLVNQNIPMSRADLGDLVLAHESVDLLAARFDLSLFTGSNAEGYFGVWTYNTDLFKPATIETMTRHLINLISAAVAAPDTPIEDLEMKSEEEMQQEANDKVKRKASKMTGLRSVSRERIDVGAIKLVECAPLTSERPMPLVIRPAQPDIDLAAWARNNQSTIDEKLTLHGGILFRGFNIDSIEKFESFAQTTCDDLLGDYGDLPHQAGSKKIYHSTPYPEEKMILYHSESSHTHRWPMKQFFVCRIASETGGETPLVDCREVYQGLAPEIRDLFEEKGLVYVRNFIPGLDVSWQQFFHTEERGAVEQRCREQGIEWEWLGDSLRTRKRRPAVMTHPKTGDKVFFNQILLHHIACLGEKERASIREIYSEEQFPRHVYFGDGSPISDEIVAELRALYDRLRVETPWQAGDLMMLDNMLVAHARNPFTGNRKINVAMGSMVFEHEFAEGGAS